MSRRLAFVHLRDARPHAPNYQRIVDGLNVSALEAIHGIGWETRVHAAAEGTVAEALAITRDADLVVVMGGEDVHPDFYDGDLEYPGGGRHERTGDEAQIAIVQDAVRRGTPLLGICRGHQVLNVALGGSLVQDLGEGTAHRDVRPGKERFVTHRLHGIDPFLARAVLAEEGVQSSHHQAIDRLGSGLRIAATSDDGVIEAVVHDSAPIVGVQWHPEHEGARPHQLVRLLRHLEAQIA